MTIPTIYSIITSAKKMFRWTSFLSKFMKTGNSIIKMEKIGMVNRAMISRQLKRGELNDWLLKLWQCTVLSSFMFCFWSSRVIWIVCTLFRLALYEKYLLRINARPQIEEMLKLKDKNTVQNSWFGWMWCILPVKSSVSVFSNDPALKMFYNFKF